MGTYVNFDQLTKNGLNTNPLTATFIPATWTLNSNGLLSVAAVPEADPAMMIAMGQTVAIEFATVAAANNYWL